MACPKTAVSHPVAPATRTRILGVLSAEERRLFLRTLAVEFDPLPAEIEWLDPVELNATSWHQHLVHHAPHVLLTAWSTPPLPLAWLQAPDCSLRYVCHLTGSVRRLVPRYFLEQGGLVSNWGTLAAATVAEHALLLGLAALRNLPAWRPHLLRPPAQRSVDDLATRSLFRRRVGLHGFGAIARELVSLLGPFHPTIAAYSPGVPAAEMTARGVQPCASLSELFARSDVLFGCEALTPATEGCVNAAVLAALPDGAVFVNVGRGRIADEAALLREATSGRIRVAVDVTSHEPIATDSPWLDAEMALVSPHIGGPTLDMYPEIGQHALQNIRNYLAGTPPRAHVTIEAYDRST